MVLGLDDAVGSTALSWDVAVEDLRSVAALQYAVAAQPLGK